MARAKSAGNRAAKGRGAAGRGSNGRAANGSANGNGGLRRGADAFLLKVGLAEMMKNGVIMDVTDAEQAKIAEDAGARQGLTLARHVMSVAQCCH